MTYRLKIQRLGLVVMVGLFFCTGLVSGDEAPAGTTLKFFTRIAPGVMRGSKPKKNADFEYLKKQEVHTLLQVRFLPFFNGHEKAEAKKIGMKYLSVPMNASPISPSEKHVNQALRIMRTQGYRPLYLHCVLGRDRTGLLVGLYKIYFEGMQKDKAYAEMRAEGFRTGFFLRGLKAYFDKHTTMPADLADLAVDPARQ